MANKQITRLEPSQAQMQQWRKDVELVEQNKDEILEEARELIAAAQLSQQALAAIRKERDRQGLSLADLMKRTGMSRSAISALENAERPNPTILTLSRLAQALGMELSVGLKPHSK